MNKNTFTWGSANGKRMLMKDLEDSHLLNVIGHLVNRKTAFITAGLDADHIDDVLDLAYDIASDKNLMFFILLKELKLMPLEVPFVDEVDKKKKFFNPKTGKIEVVA